MVESLVPVGGFLLVLASLPLALKWIKQRTPGGSGHDGGQAKFISALAIGPHQRVVTVEVGPVGQRVWLTLGVTAQGISSLHCATITPSPPDAMHKAAGLVTKDLN
jgi:flagellar protein FliO/FliZ